MKPKLKIKSKQRNLNLVKRHEGNKKYGDLGKFSSPVNRTSFECNH